MRNELFEAILLEKAKPVYQYLLKLGIQVQDAEDIVQDTMYKALFVAEDVPPYMLTPWLFRVAINRHRDLYRKLKRLQVIPIETTELIGMASLEEVSEHIKQVMQGMNPDYRHVLVLKYDYGFSYKDISLMLGMKEEIIKTMLYRARKQFGQLYKEDENEQERI